MAFETKLVQKLSQNLLMTPQLQQAIKLLQLGRFEYIEAIEAELLQNPLLEAEENKDEPQFEKLPELFEENQGDQLEKKLMETTVTDWDSYLETFHDTSLNQSKKTIESKTAFEENIAETRSLEDDLIEQIRDLDTSDIEAEILLHLLGNLDNRGYLQISLEELAEISGFSIEQVQTAHTFLTSLEPVGVGSRDLQECLLIQLDRLGLADSIETKIVENYLDLIEKRKYSQIAKKLEISLDQLKEALRRIHELDPYPARQYVQDTVRYIVPDVYIQKEGSEYQIILNEDGIPKLRINSSYSDLLKEQKDKDTSSYHTEMMKSASWLLRSIDQRQRTIYKVTESIIKFQKDFLDQGTHRLRPLVLKEVADDIGMHESTVSRITTNKYVHTPQGIFELKFFFTPGIKTRSGEMSSSAVKELIKKLIDAEPDEQPISDQKIVEVLQEQNIEIARRTVAKYRESMGIPSSSKRKKFV